MGHLQAPLSSHMCDLTRPGHRGQRRRRRGREAEARLSGRDAKRIAKVAERLPDLPTVAEALAEGEITIDHAKAMADAADQLGPETMESDPTLLEEATRSRADGFARKAQDWSNQKLIEAGIDILERQHRSRKARLWWTPRAVWE